MGIHQMLLGGGGGEGLVTITGAIQQAGSFAASGTSTAVLSHRTSGVVDFVGSAPGGTGAVTSPWLLAGAASAIEVQFVEVSRSGTGVLGGSALNTWHPMTVDRSVTAEATWPASFQWVGTYTFRSAASHAVLGTGELRLDALSNV